MSTGFCVVCASKMKLKDEEQLTCSKTHGEKLRLRRKKAALGEAVSPPHCRSCGKKTKYKEDLAAPCASCRFLTPKTPAPVKTCDWCGNLNRELGAYCSVRCGDLDRQQKGDEAPPSPTPNNLMASASASPSSFKVRSYSASPQGRYVEATQKPNGTCLYCGEALPDDSPSEKKYCSPTHARKAKTLRQRATEKREARLRENFDPNLVGRCPFPEKQVYASKEEAMKVIETTERWQLVPYLCNCLMWHVGNNTYGSRENYEAGYTDEKFRRQSKRLTENSVARMRNELRGH